MFGRKKHELSPIFDDSDRDSHDGANVMYPRTNADRDFGDWLNLTDGLDDPNLVGRARHEETSELVDYGNDTRPKTTYPRTSADTDADRKSAEAFKKRYGID